MRVASARVLRYCGFILRLGLPASVLRAMFDTPAWNVCTPEQGLVFLLIRDFILRVNQVYLMTWCVVVLA